MSTHSQLQTQKDGCWQGCRPVLLGGRVRVTLLEPPDRNSSLHSLISREPVGPGSGKQQSTVPARGSSGELGFGCSVPGRGSLSQGGDCCGGERSWELRGSPESSNQVCVRGAGTSLGLVQNSMGLDYGWALDVLVPCHLG